MASLLTTVLLAATAARAAHDAPTRIQARATSICGQWDSVETGAYTVYQDLWNEASGTGSQCTTVDAVDDANGVLSWSTSWSWSGNSSQVKSYANAVTNFTIMTLADISSIPSVWSWSYDGSDVVADVAYDMFTSSSASGSDEYEVMVWLDALGGAGPISSTGAAVATPDIAGASWELYDGYNGDMHVFSFVAAGAAGVEDFSGDLMDFLSYLVENEGMPSSQYLLSIGAGSEPFTGTSAVFSVASYSCGVSTGAATAAASTNGSAATSSAEASATATAAASSSAAAPASSGEAAPLPSSPTFASSAAPAPAQQTSSSSSSQSGVSGGPSGSQAAPTTTAAPVVTDAPAGALETATTLATSTKKACRKRRAE